VIIDDLDIVRLALGPSKADTPLIVDSNAPLARAIRPESLQLVAGRIAQIL
jgi:hypothetical protein